MNFSLYIFGTPKGRYSQFPNDYTASFLRSLQESFQGDSCLTVFRDHDLVHYAYVERLTEKECIGLCLILNKSQVTCPLKLKKLFGTAVEQLLVETGRILGFADNGALRFSVSSFDNEAPRVEALKAFLNAKFERHAKEYGIKPLSSTYNGTHTRKVLGHLSTDKQIVEATCNHNVVTVNTSDNEIANGYMTKLIASLHKEKDEALAEVADLHNRLRKSQRKQQHTLWLGLLGIITILFGFVIWNRVLFPSEVTHYETGEFVYYGPLKNGKPHGTGVAIYPKNDRDGRKYYIGNFVNGKRQDDHAILFYQGGDYFYGAMNGDKWTQGMLYMNSDKSHFSGSFVNNTPYTGTWYDHSRVLYNLDNGNKIYHLHQ